MRRYEKNQPLSITKVFELIGKPAFFLFTIVVVTIATYLHLLKLFVQRVFGFFSQINHTIQTATTKLRKLRAIRGSELEGSTQSRRLRGGEGQTLWEPIRVRPGQTLWVLLPCILGSLFYYYILKDLPSVSLLTDSPPSLSTKIYDRHGTLLYQIYKDENRSLIKLSDLPPHVIQATLAAEDKNFYSHHGISLTGILRAATNNLTRGTTQGGSTITQQLVKNVLLSPQKSLTRKLKELILSLQTESRYSKDEILEMYLNQVGYGGTAYGIEAASHEYFGKSARDLTLAEAAMLAGLPVSPTILSPFGSNPYLGKIRQQQVLEGMVQTGAISENDKLEALATPLVFHPQGIEIRAPHFVMYIKDLLVKQFGESVVARGGLVATTTLDLNYQDILQNEVNLELAKLQNLHVQNGAGLIISPKSGEILAMVGSRDFFDIEHDGQVNIVLQQRQPGSSIKPITYALAFGRGATPNTTIDDVPICFVIKGQPDYCPKNYDGRFHGSVTLRTALASSYNIPAIKLLNAYGINNMIALAKLLGITTWDDSSRFGLSLTLGGGEITMLDLASVYSVFANGGTKVPFTPFLSIRGPQGSDLTRGVSLTGDVTKGQVGTAKLEGDSPQYPQILSPSIAYQINSILSDTSARAPAFGINSILNLPGNNIAVKTGTTNALRDNWTFGYTTDLLIATWVGNNDNSPMSSVASGVTGASPVWARTMQKLLEGHSPTAFTPPENMIRVNLACAGNPHYEYFTPGTAPKINCSEKPGTLLESAAATSQ
ncbi:MAG: transglycosylase domain-containing protein [bacterium]